MFEFIKRKIGDFYQGIVHYSPTREATKVLSETQKRTMTLARSHIAKHAVYLPLRENVAEFIGSSIGSNVGAMVLGYVFSQAMRSIGYVSGIGVSATAGASIFSNLHWRHKDSPDQFRHMMKAAVLSSLVAGVIFAYLPPMMAEKGEQIGATTGNISGNIVGGILGGYVAVYLSGNQELLLNAEQPLDSYSIKSLQSLAIGFLMDIYGPKMKGVVKIIADTIGASLAYNAIDITRIIKKISNKQILDGILPEKFDLKTLLDEKSYKLLSIGETIPKGIIYSKKILDTIRTVNLFLDVKENLRGELSQMTLYIVDLLNASPLKNIQPLLKRIELFDPNLLVNLPLNSFNKYFRAIAQDEVLSRNFKNINNLIWRYSNEKDEKIKSGLLEEIDKENQFFMEALVERTDLCKKLQQVVQEAKIVGLPIKPVSEFLLTDEDVLPKIEGRELFIYVLESLASPQVKASLKKEARNLYDSMIATITDKLDSNVKQLERDIIGFNLTTEREKEWLEQTCRLHLPLLLFVIMNDILETPENRGNLDNREFYLNVNSCFWGYFQSLLPPRFRNGMEEVLAAQLRNAALA